MVLGKQASDLCTSTLTQYFVREYFSSLRDQMDQARRVTLLKKLGSLRLAARAPLEAGEAEHAERPADLIIDAAGRAERL